MRPTITQLRQWFNEYNLKYFNNELPTERINFDLSNRRSAWGDCRYPTYFSFRYVIRLSIYFDRDEKSCRQTLIHEMIHVYCHLKYNERGHKVHFKMECARINKDGWNLSTRTSSKETDTITNLPVSRYVFIFKHVNYPNKICVARTTTAKSSYIYDLIKRLSHRITLLDIKKSDDACLAHLKDCRTRLTFNIYSPTEFKEKFANL